MKNIKKILIALALIAVLVSSLVIVVATASDSDPLESYKTFLNDAKTGETLASRNNAIRKLYNYLDGCDLAGYNLSSFDIPMLETEFKRAGYDFKLEGRRVLDAYNIFCKMFPRTLTGAYKFFCGKDLEGAHGAAADTDATWEVIQGELAKYPELPRDIAGLAAFCEQSEPDMVDRTRRFRWVGDDVVVNFGKFSGRQLKDIAQNEPGFLRWIMRSDFPAEVQKIASDALIGKFPVKKQNGGTDSN